MVAQLDGCSKPGVHVRIFNWLTVLRTTFSGYKFEQPNNQAQPKVLREG